MVMLLTHSFVRSSFSLALFLTTSTAWIPYYIRHHDAVAGSPSTAQFVLFHHDPFAGDDNMMDVARRDVLVAMSSVLVGTGAIPWARAAEDPDVPKPIDPLDVFGKQLQQQGVAAALPIPEHGARWPHSLSPLPEAEDEGDNIPKDSTATATAPSDMQQALEQAAKRKRIDPRTHG